jgi:hypothetical protein
MTGSAKQSMSPVKLDCFVALLLAMTGMPGDRRKKKDRLAAAFRQSARRWGNRPTIPIIGT